MNPQVDMQATAAARFAPDGAMTVYEAAQHKAALLAALEGAGPLEVDLGAVREFDTAGLQLLLLAWREAGRNGGSLALRAVSDEVADVLDLYHLREVFQPTCGSASANPNPSEP